MKTIVFVLFFIPYIFLAQSLQKVDFIEVKASIDINPVLQNVNGKATYTFVQKEGIDTLRIDAHDMSFNIVKINNKTVPYKNTQKELLLFEGFTLGTNELYVEYQVRPKQTMYFVNWNFTQEIDTPEEVEGQIWTQGQGKRTSYWFPCIDDVNEKMIFNLDITFEKSFEVISNGVLVNTISDGTNITWQYRMTKPMSSYLLMIAIGHFNKQTIVSHSRIPLIQYYENQDIDKLETTYRYSKAIFDYLENEIGVSYPWEVYKQAPVKDFLYSGMENTSATLFSNELVVDSIGFVDKNYINVNAHELAHQWFGNLVTAQSGKDHWLQEGFATYYALLAERALFGDDHFYWQLYKNAEQLKSVVKEDTIPLLNEKASSLTFYQKGAWALHVIRETIGEKKFQKAVKSYLEKYAFQNTTTNDFLEEIKKVSHFDVVAFSQTWLEAKGIDSIKTRELLSKNKFIKAYFDLDAQKKEPLIQKEKQLKKILQSNAYYPLKVAVVNQLRDLSFEEKKDLLLMATNTPDIKVRQSVVGSMRSIPEDFRTVYESFLDDRSYVTQEIALIELWKAFPEQRTYYLQKSKNWIGFSNRNLELLHSALVLFTPDYKEENKGALYLKLLHYSGTNYDASTRQQALEYLLSLKISNKDILKSLVYATTHHKWQFAKFGRDSLRRLILEDQNKIILEAMIPELLDKEQIQVTKILHPES